MLEPERLETIAKEHGTPIYVSDTDSALKRYLRLVNSLPSLDVRYATKANFDPELVSKLYKQDAKFVCGSSEEAMLLYNKANVPASHLQVTAVSPKESCLRNMIELSKVDTSFKVTINDFDTLERLVNDGYKGRVLLRLRPNIDNRASSKYSKGSYLKFGMLEEEIGRCLELLDDSDAELYGFHSHLGGSFQGDEIEKYCSHVEDTTSAVSDLVDVSSIEEVNFGGGLGISEQPDDVSIDLDELNSFISLILPEWDVDFVIEPGRYIAGPCSVLLTEARTIRQEEEERFVGIDAGMAEFLRPAMFETHHPIRVVGKEMGVKQVKQTVAGPTCSGADVVCASRLLPKIARGDLLAIENVGAYGFVMSSPFHAYKLPRIYDVDKKKVTRISDLLYSE